MTGDLPAAATIRISSAAPAPGDGASPAPPPVGTGDHKNKIPSGTGSNTLLTRQDSESHTVLYGSTRTHKIMAKSYPAGQRLVPASDGKTEYNAIAPKQVSGKHAILMSPGFWNDAIAFVYNIPTENITKRIPISVNQSTHFQDPFKAIIVT